MNSITVADIIAAMEKIAPPCLSENWDNAGLQIGCRSWPVNKIWVALDPSPLVLKKACEASVDLLITHHPLFFSPLKTLDLDTIKGRCVEICICNRLSVYSAHTNMDSVAGGLNDIFANRIGLSNCRVLDQPKKLQNANIDADDPVPTNAPPSPPQSDGCHGIGRIGELSHPMKLKELAFFIKQRFNLNAIRLVGDPELELTRAAICTGSGAGLLDRFISSDAQVFVSGDIRYHEAMTVLDAGKALIDVGHFASEQIMIDAVVDRLNRWAKGLNVSSITVEACHLEKDPFTVLV